MTAAALSTAAPVIIMGTGGFALELGELVLSTGRSVAGFVGPAADCPLPAPWLGEDSALAAAPPAAEILVAAGNPALRQRLSQSARALGRTIATFVHPAAWVAASARIGAGSMVYPNSTVHAGVSLGEGVLVNSNASIGHETQIGAFCNLGPGCALGGRSRLGERVFVGIGACLLERLEVAADCVIGAGAAVTRPLPHAGRWVGVPARCLDAAP